MELILILNVTWKMKSVCIEKTELTEIIFFFKKKPPPNFARSFNLNFGLNIILIWNNLKNV